MSFHFPAAWRLAILALLFPAALAAQAVETLSSPQGFHFGLMLNGSAITFEDDDVVESGGGASVALGWGVSRAVTLFVEGSGAAVQYDGFDDTYTLGFFDLGARFNLGGPAQKVLPFLVVGYSGRAAILDLGEDLTMAGTGPTLGGGVAVFLNPKTAIDIGLKWTGGSFTEAEYAGYTETIDVAASSVRFEVGVAWWGG